MNKRAREQSNGQMISSAYYSLTTLHEKNTFLNLKIYNYFFTHSAGVFFTLPSVTVHTLSWCIFLTHSLVSHYIQSGGVFFTLPSVTVHTLSWCIFHPP